jgi:hypothetical protein
MPNSASFMSNQLNYRASGRGKSRRLQREIPGPDNVLLDRQQNSKTVIDRYKFHFKCFFFINFTNK